MNPIIESHQISNIKYKQCSSCIRSPHNVFLKKTFPPVIIEKCYSLFHPCDVKIIPLPPQNQGYTNLGMLIKMPSKTHCTTMIFSWVLISIEEFSWFMGCNALKTCDKLYEFFAICALMRAIRLFSQIGCFFTRGSYPWINTRSLLTKTHDFVYSSHISIIITFLLLLLLLW